MAPAIRFCLNHNGFAYLFKPDLSSMVPGPSKKGKITDFPLGGIPRGDPPGGSLRGILRGILWGILWGILRGILQGILGGDLPGEHPGVPPWRRGPSCMLGN